MFKTEDFQYESATCQIINWEDGSSTLADLYAGTRCQGHATQLLTNVTRWADERGMTLKLIAHAHGRGDKPSTPRLVQFYKSFGFVPEPNALDYVYMERQPK